jgi:hypothetical protein
VFLSGLLAIIAYSTDNAVIRQRGEPPVMQRPALAARINMSMMAQLGRIGSESCCYPQDPAAFFQCAGLWCGRG